MNTAFKNFGIGCGIKILYKECECHPENNHITVESNRSLTSKEQKNVRKFLEKNCALDSKIEITFEVRKSLASKAGSFLLSNVNYVVQGGFPSLIGSVTLNALRNEKIDLKTNLLFGLCSGLLSIRYRSAIHENFTNLQKNFAFSGNALCTAALVTHDVISGVITNEAFNLCVGRPLFDSEDVAMISAVGSFAVQFLSSLKELIHTPESQVIQNSN